MSGSEVLERTVRIRNRQGLHARPAAELVKLASRFESDVQLSKEGLTVNGKSIMGVLMLAAEKGTDLALRVEGRDAHAAADALQALVENGFGEV